MNSKQARRSFQHLTTPHVADACVRLGVPVRLAPPGIRPMVPGRMVVGKARPARHYGSVDVFLEAAMLVEPGDILVVDNQGRLDEGCIGDLIAIEAKVAGVAALVVWGAHRDTAELRRLDIPVFSYGTCPLGPLRLEPRPHAVLDTADFGSHLVAPDDVVIADDDGVIFVGLDWAGAVADLARQIAEGERRQVDAVQQGESLRAQFRFEDYLSQRDADPTYSFRAHLRQLKRFIEE